MERYLVKERRDLERDKNSKAVLSRDNQAYRKRLNRKKAIAQKEIEIFELKNKVNNLTKLVNTLIEKIDK